MSWLGGAPPPSSEDQQILRVNQTRVLSACLLLSSLPAAFAPEVGNAMEALLGEANAANPYFSGLRPALLYLAMPVCVASSMVLLLCPGLLIALAMQRAGSWAEWLLQGFVLSLFSVSATTAVAQTALGEPLVGRTFFALVLALGFAAAWLLDRRCARDPVRVFPWASSTARFALASCVAVPVCLAIGLTPKIFWEAFNGDGAHAYESTRLLLHHALPFWSPEAGDVASWPGMAGLVSVYPVSWFLRLFGEGEAGVRLPLLLNLMLLFAAIVAASEVGRAQPLKARSLALVWASVVGFGLVMSYSATYDPYSADMAMPAVMDTLVMVVFLAAVVAFARQDTAWLVVWSLLCLMTAPAGFLQLAAALLGLLLSTRPMPWRSVIWHGLGLVACLAALAIAPGLLGLLGLQTPGSEHGPLRFLLKFGYLALADFERIGWALLPCGVYPAIALFQWRRADRISRVLIVVTGSLFAMYYVMGFVSLHYFVPVMVLPVAVFWRAHGGDAWGPLPWLACCAAAALSLWLALPASHAIYTGTRVVGQRIETVGFSGYDRMAPLPFLASQRLEALFPKDMDPAVPQHAYGGSPLAWLYYSKQREMSHEARRRSARPSYRLSHPASPTPWGVREVHRDEVAAVYVYDEAQWQTDRLSTPSTSKGKPVFAAARNRLFNHGEASERRGFFSPGKWLLGLLRRER